MSSDADQGDMVPYPPSAWIPHEPFDFDIFDREPPHYEDEDQLGDGTDPPSDAPRPSP